MLPLSTCQDLFRKSACVARKVTSLSNLPSCQLAPHGASAFREQPVDSLALSAGGCRSDLMPNTVSPAPAPFLNFIKGLGQGSGAFVRRHMTVTMHANMGVHCTLITIFAETLKQIKNTS